MKASWSEIQKIEQYLSGTGCKEEIEATRVQMLCDTALYEKVHWQRVTHAYVRAYAREALKMEIAQAQNVVFGHPSHEKFRKIVQKIFS